MLPFASGVNRFFRFRQNFFFAFVSKTVPRRETGM